MKLAALAGMALGLLSLGCSPLGAVEDEPTIVELDVFSGQPNPQWTLTPEEASEVRRRLDRLPLAGSGSMPSGRLGYRGFYLHHAGAICDRVGVSAGLIFGTEAPAAGTIYQDANGLELWLIGQARTRGFDALVPAAP
jgi:hypothetical protein